MAVLTKIKAFKMNLSSSLAEIEYQTVTGLPEASSGYEVMWV